MRTVVVALLLPLLAVGADSWDRVTGLAPGSMLKVRTFDGQENKGAMASVDAESVTLQTGVRIARSEVSRVAIHDSGRRARNAIIGGAIGAAAGIVIAFGSCVSCRGELPAGEANTRLAIGGVAGGGAGAALGAVMAPYKTVYRAKRPRKKG